MNGNIEVGNSIDQNQSDESYSHVDRDYTPDLKKLYQVKKKLNFNDI